MRSNRLSIQSRFPEIVEGMVVYSNSGDKLGKIVQLGDDFLTIEKGIFFPRDFTADYDDIESVREGSLYLKSGQSELQSWKNDSYEGWKHTDDINANRLSPVPRAEFKDRYSEFEKDEIRVPVAEEELQAVKTARQVGEIKIHKIAHTEYRHFTVPVTREEVRISREPVTDQSTISNLKDKVFQDKDIRVPIMEEEISVTKRPVVKEEIRVSKERTTEERTVEGEVRKEDVQIEGEDKLKRKKAG